MIVSIDPEDPSKLELFEKKGKEVRLRKEFRREERQQVEAELSSLLERLKGTRR